MSYHGTRKHGNRRTDAGEKGHSMTHIGRGNRQNDEKKEVHTTPSQGRLCTKTLSARTYKYSTAKPYM